MGYFGGNWSYSSYKRVVTEALRDGKKRVGLDTEHCSYISDEDIKKWAELDGYKTIHNMDSITVIMKE